MHKIVTKTYNKKKFEGRMAMLVCPLCNSLHTLQKRCPNCNQLLEDGGRASDYFDPYNHYLDIEITNANDGVLRSHASCPHLLYCPHCGHDEIALIKERRI